MMRQFKIWGLQVLYVGLLFASISQLHAEGSLHDLDTMVERWMLLRATIADEKRVWKAQKQQWEGEIALLKQESETLSSEIEAANTFVSSVEKERSTALQQKEKMEAELEKLETVITEAENELRKWQKRIPSGLQKHVTAFDMLPVASKGSKYLSLPKRAQAVAAIYAQIEFLQNQLHTTQELLDTGTTRRQVEVLYMGLSIAYAVSPGNDWAAIGTPSAQQWIWTPSEKDAKTIRQAIDIFKRQEPAKLITLPITVTGEVSQ